MASWWKSKRDSVCGYRFAFYVRVLWVYAKDFGYLDVAAVYYKGELSNNQFKLLWNDNEVLEFFQRLSGGEVLYLFITHNIDEPQCIKTRKEQNTDTEDIKTGEDVIVESGSSSEDENIDENKVREGESYKSKSYAEGVESGEENNVRCHDLGDSDANEDVQQARVRLRRYKKSGPCPVVHKENVNEIPIGEIWDDEGYEYNEFGTSKYAGKVGGDEHYIDSFDPESIKEEPMRGMSLWDETGKPPLDPLEVTAMLDKPKKDRNKARNEPKKIEKLGRAGSAANIASTSKATEKPTNVAYPAMSFNTTFSQNTNVIPTQASVSAIMLATHAMLCTPAPSRLVLGNIFINTRGKSTYKTVGPIGEESS
ncbi:conserved hypothetical protein [Ricinus communis]|uniref:Uncharacterized protein n=1 Tax=Ricinus communis TaxID=3988 RepID=B9T268_RICCO|nr:conserved hypothetical protein [Ricinus communis]